MLRKWEHFNIASFEFEEFLWLTARWVTWDSEAVKKMKMFPLPYSVNNKECTRSVQSSTLH